MAICIGDKIKLDANRLKGFLSDEWVEAYNKKRYASVKDVTDYIMLVSIGDEHPSMWMPTVFAEEKNGSKDKNHCFNGICKSHLFSADCKFKIDGYAPNDPFCMNWDKASDRCNCPKANDSEFDQPDSIMGLWGEVKEKESLIESMDREIADLHRSYQDEIAKLKGQVEGLKETVDRKSRLKILGNDVRRSGIGHVLLVGAHDYALINSLVESQKAELAHTELAHTEPSTSEYTRITIDDVIGMSAVIEKTKNARANILDIHTAYDDLFDTAKENKKKGKQKKYFVPRNQKRL